MAKHKQSKGYRDATRAADRPASRNRIEERPQNRLPGGRLWLFGRHPVEAALANARRGKIRLLATPEALESLDSALLAAPGCPPPETAERATIDNLVPPNAVHQGLALMVEPLPQLTIDDICQIDDPNALVVALDRAHDPHNIGAILRSAAAFGVAAVLLPERHAPDSNASGTLAKAASGAMEHVPLVRVPNLVQALKRLKENGFWVAGLTADAPRTIVAENLTGRLVLVVGAEGDGMRRLSAETCDYLVKIPMTGVMESLNMSNAAAIALYELRRKTLS